MLIKCSECGGDVSDKAPACPHCGAPVPSQDAAEEQQKSSAAEPAVPKTEPKPRRIPVEEEDEDLTCPELYPSEPPRSFDAASAFLAVIKFLFFLLALLVLCGTACFFILRSDAGGIATKLRNFAESDSGDGSHIDRDGKRMFFKFHLAEILNIVQGVEPSRKTSEPTGKTAAPADPPPDSLPRPKTERKPLELPPPPPDKI